MIVKAILDVVMGLLSTAFDGLPTGNIASLLQSINATMTTVGGAMSGWNVFLPLSELAGLLSLLLGTWVPAIVTYKLLNWAWRHIPDVGGFGPGAG